MYWIIYKKSKWSSKNYIERVQMLLFSYISSKDWIILLKYFFLNYRHKNAVEESQNLTSNSEQRQKPDSLFFTREYFYKKSKNNKIRRRFLRFVLKFIIGMIVVNFERVQ